MADKFTDAIVKTLPAPAKGNKVYYERGDKAVPGFGVRVTAAGARSFILNYRTAGGRERRMTIGGPPTWTVTAAREEAKGLRKRVDRGEDPMGERAEHRAAPTMSDLCARYEAEHLPKKRETSAREDKALIKRFVLPELKHLKVADVAFEDVDGLHRKITRAGTPFQANRVLALLSKMFSLAIKWKMRADNPCRGVERNAEESRERYLTPDEIKRLMKALAAYEDSESGNAIMLALLTGARRSELLRATWAQFDLKAGIWTKPSAHTKQKKPHRVPLSEPAIRLLRWMQERAPVREPRLFPGRINKDGRVDIRRPWETVCKAAGLEGVRFHDLRHSYASLLASSGQSLPIIGRLLGHTQPATTQRYVHLMDDPLRVATGRVGAIVGGARVIHSKKRAR